MRRISTLAVTAAVAAALGLATPASAEVQNRTDPRGDTFTQVRPQTFSATSSADIVRLQGRHGDGELKFTATVANLTEEGTYFVSRFVTAGGKEYYATLVREGSEKSTQLFAGDGEGGQPQPVECEGQSGRFLTAKDQYVISVPRSCVRNPRSVRFGGGVYAFGGDGAVSDDARRNGGDTSSPLTVKLGTRALANN